MDTEPVQLTFLRLEKAIQRTPYHPRGWVERADLQLNTFSAKFLPLAAEDVFKTIILCETHINTNDRPSWWMGYEMGFMMRTEDDDRRYNRFWLTWAKLTPYRGQASIILINALLRMDQFHDAESVCFMVMDWNSNELAEDIRRFILEAQDGIKSGKEGNTKVGPYLDYPWVDSKYLARSDELVQSINQEFARNEATRRLGFQACQLRDIVGEEDGVPHPLDHHLISRLTPGYLDSTDRWFNMIFDVEISMRVLRSLGIDVFADVRYDTWVLNTIMARIWNNKWRGTDRDRNELVAINPLFTMFNPRCSPNVSWDGERTATVNIVASREIKKGEELRVYYVDCEQSSLRERQKVLLPWFKDSRCRKCKYQIFLEHGSSLL
ncbi:hypothetical protein M501DRAFT_991455 [Patellaria atrata CBS 101060]|uniref:Histone-lysine N-methyltransferase SET5 n=1 Tax=Patellaria atrata CBS 101060 TaxID=1346257 RepID=A0A9P4SD80_9PEZI|nr:hypothetical protein M501DRAFT_991455 [Patellaria atrata CBS 101060]